MKHLPKSVHNLICITFIWAVMWGASALAATDVINAYQDTQVRIINNGPWGSLGRLRVDYDGNNQSRHTMAVMQFMVNPIDIVHKAELFLDIETFTYHESSATFAVWGVTEGAPEESWNESSLKYLDWDYFFDGSSDGVAAGSWRITDLGTMVVTSADLNKTVSHSTRALADFLEANQNSKVTIIIARLTNNYSFRTAFASKEHSSLAGPRLAVTSKDRFITPYDDTWCQKGDKNAVHGSDDDLLVKMDENGDASTVRKAVLEFGLHADVTARDAALILTPKSVGNGLSSAQFYIWGFSNESNLENWNENTANYNTFGAIFNSSSDGVDNGTNRLFDGDVTESKDQALGILTIRTSDIGKPISFTSDALLNFINNNDNSRVTFAITRKTDHAGISSFYSDETSNPPILMVRPLLEQQTPGPDSEFTYMDVDHDGQDDLVLLINTPEGGGFAIAEPFVIADYLNQLGIDLGNDDRYYQKLSDSQKESLNRTVYGFNTNCAYDQNAGPVMGPDIETALARGDNDREYPISEFDDRYTLAHDVDSHGIDIAVSYPGCDIWEYNAGDLSVTISGPSYQAGATFTDGGMHFGAEQTVASISVTYGNTNGSYVGLSASAGQGFWFDASWGENGQYGATIPIPKTPVSVAIYVEGSDAVAVYNMAKNWTQTNGSQAAQYFEGRWSDAVDWSEDTLVTVKDVANETKIYMKQATYEGATYARVWIEDAGSQTVVEMKGSYNDVRDTMRDIENGVTNTTANIADNLENIADDAGSVVVSIWNDGSGWVKGSADSISKGIKKVIKWF